MKKLIPLLALIAVFTTGAAFADHSDSFGIGTIVTYEGYDVWALFGYGITLKAPYVPVFAGAKFYFFNPYRTIMTFTADYHIFGMPLSNTPLIKKISLFENLKLDWYAGLGIDYQLYLYNAKCDYTGYSIHGIGIRAPLGFIFHATEKIDVFLEAAPTPYYGIRQYGENFISVYTPVGLGTRFLF